MRTDQRVNLLGDYLTVGWIGEIAGHNRNDGFDERERLFRRQHLPSEHDMPHLRLDEPAPALDQPADLPEDASILRRRAVVIELPQEFGNHRVRERQLTSQRE
jgi:hypothetical protein